MCLIDVEALHIVVELLLTRFLEPDLRHNHKSIGSNIEDHTHTVREINDASDQKMNEQLIKLKMHKNGKLINWTD